MANMAIANPSSRTQNKFAEVEVSVVMPCLNEAQTVGTCIGKALQAFREAGIAGEVIVADNGSTDGSQEIATRLGARVVPVKDRGYGSALMGGIVAASGKYIIMGDADDSYDFGHIPRFLQGLRAGDDLVMGNRFRGGILPGAMPPLHKYLGNPALTRIGRLFFGGAAEIFTVVCEVSANRRTKKWICVRLGWNLLPRWWSKPISSA